LIPVGVFASKAFSPAFDAIRADGFDGRYFDRNGVFLPATEAAALRSGLSLHRGPHRRYNELVAYRIAAIFRDHSYVRYRQSARRDAVERINLLVNALRNVLTRSPPYMSLNQRDPFHNGVNFDNIDAACEAIWNATK
jgi:hypothetical protein